MGGVQAFFEEMAMVIIGGCCAAAWMSSFIFINLFGIGECPVISGIIGAALGIGSLFILPIDVMWLSMVIAAVVTLIAGIIIDKAFYVQTKDLPKASSSSAPVQQAQPRGGKGAPQQGEGEAVEHAVGVDPVAEGFIHPAEQGAEGGDEQVAKAYPDPCLLVNR